MEEPQKLLEHLGLNEKEARVYLGLLQIGQSSVLALSRRTGLKRPTIYLVLDDLIRKGFAATVLREKKKLYIALPPERLQENLERKRESLQQLLPQLTALWAQKTAKPVVQLFEGLDAINNLYREIFTSGTEDIETFYAFDPIKKFQESYEPFIRLFKKNPRIRSRELVYAKNPKEVQLPESEKLSNRHIRFVTEHRAFSTDNIFWLDKAAIISPEKEFAVVVQSKDVVDSFRSLFDLAWVGAAKNTD